MFVMKSLVLLHQLLCTKHILCFILGHDLGIGYVKGEKIDQKILFSFLQK